MTHFGPYDAVIFDMDGTLLDTEAMFKSIVSDVAEAMGLVFTEALHLSIVGGSHENTRRLLLEAFGPDFPYEEFDARCVRESRARMEAGVPLKPGAATLVAALRESAVPLAVATSSRAQYAASRLRHAGLLDHLDVLVTRDDVTHPKPHPEPYLTAADRLRVDPRACLAFEDSHAGVRAAHAAGMRTIMVPDLLHPTEEIAALCFAVLDSLDHAHERMLGPVPAAALP